MERSLKSLKIEGYPSVYFISLRKESVEKRVLQLDFGRKTSEYHYRFSQIVPELRVGSYSFDNRPLGKTDLRIDPDFPESGPAPVLRHGLWRMLDGLYKKASGEYLVKRAQRVQRGQAEYDFDDLSQEEPIQKTEPPAPPELDLPKIQKELQDLGSSLVHPDLLNLSMEFRLETSTALYLNTEGSRVLTHKTQSSLALALGGISKEGLPLNLNRSFYAFSPGSLLRAETFSDIRGFTQNFHELLSAPEGSSYTGPAVLDPELSGFLFQVAAGSFLTGENLRDPEEGRFFFGKMGHKILPEFITLEDDPSAGTYRGMDLIGSYSIDEEGVPAQKTILVKKGVLKDYLLSRYPVKGFPKSNGHGRAAFGYKAAARVGNLFVRGGKGLSRDALKKELMDLARRQGKPYALMLSGFSHFQIQTQSRGGQTIRIRPDKIIQIDARTGEEKPIKGLDWVATPLVVLEKIASTGNDSSAFNRLDHGLSGSIGVSVVCPSLLISELELQKSTEKPQRPPILPSPY